jgi:hypothetical protein
MTDAPLHQMTPPVPPFDPDRQVQARIRAEFREMPGMRLTMPQAARLFNLDKLRCARVLQALVETGALWTDGRQFLSPSGGRPSG